ncbi:nucleotide-binding oligomerization domain-containing protein 2 [Corythoichthys intestinalis]|uniref:nucleotide-binding oligomerization domain-containing protein 2 n=1 Tax=Corythoichthys intestinalis TaxID=161448 RepID=UPI0025A50020|nr:nucleotide-binding oligomerization domain-containing protein 2 [Corythoichthys intestinalis]XP_057707511.1 nucleotide-binding oligomerization domain-containing protein 2 [Corythoichthys intestinalis]XP_057707522.1 nucleotide-binding oligomerization domain-containing protein 2 [Corythoichthys intestinalis]XP_061796228.1 nucleotide-binding oligomerization domain-containing protein 2-like [Nerophis lumbriciformis]
MAQDLVLKQRSELLNDLCASGLSEPLEKVMDVLLARGELSWEDYTNVSVQGRSLYTNARHLLDLVYAKGEAACQAFFVALRQIQTPEDPGPVTRTLLTQRPGLVRELQGCLDGALEALLESECFTQEDCRDILLHIHTPSQQARRLLDLVSSKGDSAANVILRYIEQKQNNLKQETTTPKELLKYQKKLRSSILAQSSFISTYGGTGHMSLDDIYTEGKLELAHDCKYQGHLGLEDIVAMTGTVNEEADTVLVSGDAGSGKSTLLQRLHLLWARGAALQQFVLLFPFSCRKLNSELDELSVQELLFRHCCWPDCEQDEIFRFILDHPHLVVIMFDSLDELKQSFSDERRLCSPTQPAPVHVLLFNLLQGSLLKGVLKLVTSRPEAVGPMLRMHLRKELFLKGFSPEGINCFIKKQHRDSLVASKVLASIQANTALFGLCHSPVLCWIVSQCHKELLGCGDGTPQTITDVYLMILQHFLQHQSPPKCSRGPSWLKDHLLGILHLGKLAFQGVESSCYIFASTDLDTCCVTDQDICAGFLTQTKDIPSHQSLRYEFLHVTMQCFFAALYIVLSNNTNRSTVAELFELKDVGFSSTCFGSCLSADQQQGLVEAPNLQITATFVCGLLSQRHRHLWLDCAPTPTVERKAQQVVRCLHKGMQKHFKSIPKPVEGEKKSMHAMPGFVWLVKCIYEMRESNIAEEALSKLDVDHLKLTYCNIGPVECTALAFVLQHLRSPAGIQLDNNSVGDVGVEQLLPCLHICKSLYLRNNNITDEGIRKLIAKGIQCDNFQKIALFNNKLTDACTQHISHLLKTKQNFLSLRLGNNCITSEGAKQLAMGLECNHSLMYLGLWGNKIGDSGAEAIASALEGSKTLVWLSLVGNGVGSIGARALSKTLKTCPSLEDLWLTENCITKEGVESLVQALQHNKGVKSVWLKNNLLSPEEVEEMTQQESRLVF